MGETSLNQLAPSPLVALALARLGPRAVSIHGYSGISSAVLRPVAPSTLLTLRDVSANSFIGKALEGRRLVVTLVADNFLDRICGQGRAVVIVIVVLIVFIGLRRSDVRVGLIDTRDD